MSPFMHCVTLPVLPHSGIAKRSPTCPAHVKLLPDLSLFIEIETHFIEIHLNTDPNAKQTQSLNPNLVLTLTRKLSRLKSPARTPDVPENTFPRNFGLFRSAL